MLRICRDGANLENDDGGASTLCNALATFFMAAGMVSGGPYFDDEVLRFDANRITDKLSRIMLS